MKTRTIRVALYKNSKSIFGGLIRLQQKLQGFSKEHAQFSHAEIVFVGLRKEEVSLFQEPFCNSEKDFFFSSSETDGGVRFMTCKPKKGNWDFTEIEVSEKQYSDMLNEAIRLNGRNYGWAGIFFAQTFNYNLKNSLIARAYYKVFGKYFGYFCSETVVKILSKGFGNKFSKSFYKNYEVFINPGKLSKRLKEFLK